MASVAALEITDAPRMQRARGTGRISTGMRDGITRIGELYQDGAAKIRLPNTHDNSLQAVLMNTAGGLTGGDAFDWHGEAAPNAHLVLTTPACERVYRSLGTDAVVANRLIAHENARVDWLPQETILFEGARLRRTLDVDLAEGATLLAVEAILLGRQAMGEAALAARLSDNWRIRRNGRLIHAEATSLNADLRERQSLSLLDGALAFATVLYIGADAPRQLDATRALLPANASAAASAIGERLIVRFTAPSGLALRRLMVPIIAMLSSAGSLPRLWHL
jgi:urease accessory protein